MKKYYGGETERALSNFAFSGPRVSINLIHAISEIKIAAARAWISIGGLDGRIGAAIIKAADEVRRGKFDGQFILPSLQGGAGTSLHMNVNEIIAARASEIIGKSGSISLEKIVHPLDHVNKGQSTNDVVPSALRIECARGFAKILKAGEALATELDKKGKEFEKVTKLARTHLQDATPIALGEEFRAFAYNVRRECVRVKAAMPFFYELNLGGTAVGNGISAPKNFVGVLYREIRKLTKLPLKKGQNLVAFTSAAGDFAAAARVLGGFTMALSKMANDLRIMASGPRGGIGEIVLKSLQNGSTIMPGKVNPVALEVLNQLHFIVEGNALSICESAHAAQLELSHMTPLIAERLLSSITTINEVVENSTIDCVKSIAANKENCLKHLDNSMACAALLISKLGYDKASLLVARAIKNGVTLRELIVEEKIMSEKEFFKLTGRA